MLAGDQTLPNLLPFIELCRPTTDYALVLTDEKAPLGYALANLRGFLLDWGLPPEHFRVKGVSKLDLQTTAALMRPVLASYPEDAEFIFNMTSGTKIMALACYQLALEMGERGRLIYLDSDQSRILDLLPQTSATPLTTDLTIAQYLRAHGYYLTGAQLRRGDTQPQKRTLAARHLAHLPAPLLRNLALNLKWTKTKNGVTLISSAAGSEYSTTSSSSVNTSSVGSLKALDGILGDVEVIRSVGGSSGGGSVGGGGGSEEGRGGEGEGEVGGGEELEQLRPYFEPNFFPGGGWLEQYVFDCAAGLPGVKEVLGGVTVVASAEGVENELDVIFMRGQHFWLCSCKTGNKPDSQWLYDLTDRARSLGTYCHKILVVNFDTSQAASFRQRAARSQIRVLDSNSLPNLSQHFDLREQDK
jgi:hypothetical protein